MSDACPGPEGERSGPGKRGFWRRLGESRFGSFDLIVPGIHLVRLVWRVVHFAARAIIHPSP